MVRVIQTSPETLPETATKLHRPRPFHHPSGGPPSPLPRGRMQASAAVLAAHTRPNRPVTGRCGSGEVVRHGAVRGQLRRSKPTATVRTDRPPLHSLFFPLPLAGRKLEGTTNKQERKEGKWSADRRVANDRTQRDAARATPVRVTTHERCGRARLSAFHRGARGSDRTPPLSSSYALPGSGGIRCYLHLRLSQSSGHCPAGQSSCRPGVFRRSRPGAR